MKTVLLHGLGQTAQDWKDVVCQLSTSNVECPDVINIIYEEDFQIDCLILHGSLL